MKIKLFDEFKQIIDIWEETKKEWIENYDSYQEAEDSALGAICYDFAKNFKNNLIKNGVSINRINDSTSHSFYYSSSVDEVNCCFCLTWEKSYDDWGKKSKLPDWINDPKYFKSNYDYCIGYHEWLTVDDKHYDFITNGVENVFEMKFFKDYLNRL